MAEITASLVKELREMTGAGMMECKNCLLYTSDDLAQALKELENDGSFAR